jgi:hypothetical protein
LNNDLNFFAPFAVWGFIAWLVVGTKIPLLIYTVVLLVTFPRNNMAEDLIKSDGPGAMLSYSQLRTMLGQKSLAKKEISGLIEDYVGNKSAWIVEFKSGKKKVVLLPEGAMDIEETGIPYNYA